MLRQALINLDVAAGRYLAFKHPAYIRETILTEGHGTYSRDEWIRARKSGYRDAGAESEQLNSDESYLRRMFSTHVCNLQAALRLAHTIDFNAFGSVLEIGCGEMIQAFILRSIYPEMRYRATDFDPFILSKCAGLPLLSHIEKQELNIATIRSVDLKGFDLVLAWEVFYALDDPALSGLFLACKGAGASLLVCTSQLTGPLRRLARALKQLNWRPDGFYYKRLLKQKRLRMHGWNHSIGYYVNLANKVGLELAETWHSPASQRRPERFCYLLFRPSSATA